MLVILLPNIEEGCDQRHPSQTLRPDLPFG